MIPKLTPQVWPLFCAVGYFSMVTISYFSVSPSTSNSKFIRCLKLPGFC
jgi:hypothetical protein